MSILGESGNCARGPGESGRDKFHSSGNRGMKKCRGTRGIGDLGFPVEPLVVGTTKKADFGCFGAFLLQFGNSSPFYHKINYVQHLLQLYKNDQSR